jgi:predicted TIM-barrel fold metal-dependent hydrolase
MPTRSAMSRRSFIAAAMAAVSGCTTTGPRVQATTCAPGGPQVLCSPEIRAAWSQPQCFFDAHAHFFNAADVPVENFIVKSFGHPYESGPVEYAMLRALAPVAAQLAKTLAIDPASELRDLCQFQGEYGSSTPDAVAEELDRRVKAHKDLLKNELSAVRSSFGAEALRLLDAAMLGVKRDRADSQLLLNILARDDMLEKSLNYGSPVLSLRGRGAAALSSAERDLASVMQTIFFVGVMLSPRHHNLRTYVKGCHEGSPRLPLSGVLSAMVDFNYWLDAPEYASRMQDQVLVQEQMAMLSGGFMLPIVGYNPWVDIKEDGASLKLVLDAVNKHGCVGVKIYPPMGFYPYGNESNPLRGSLEQRPDLHMLDETLMKFFETCRDNDIPVLAHGDDSNGRDAPSDALGGSNGWLWLDEALDGDRPLRVDVGHFGGDLPRTPDETAGFEQLMRSAKHIELYGDIAYWDALADAQHDAEAKLSGILAKPKPVQSRVMYGSDWNMLARYPGWRRYGQTMLEAVQTDAPASVASVFGANALACYGLVPGSKRKAWSRFTQYWTSGGRSLPGWTSAPAA